MQTPSLSGFVNCSTMGLFFGHRELYLLAHSAVRALLRYETYCTGVAERPTRIAETKRDNCNDTVCLGWTCVACIHHQPATENRWLSSASWEPHDAN